MAREIRLKWAYNLAAWTGVAGSAVAIEVLADSRSTGNWIGGRYFKPGTTIGEQLPITFYAIQFGTDINGAVVVDWNPWFDELIFVGHAVNKAALASQVLQQLLLLSLESVESCLVALLPGFSHLLLDLIASFDNLLFFLLTGVNVEL